MKKRLSELIVAILISALFVVQPEPASAIVSINPLGSCPDQPICSTVEFGPHSDVSWGESFTVTVNASGWCSSEIGADDINGLSIREDYDSVGFTHPSFVDTSPPGVNGIHTGVITIPQGAQWYWVSFSTVCGVTGINGAIFLTSWTKTYEMQILPRPLAAPGNVRVVAHESSFIVSWDPVSKADRYIVSVGGTYVCDSAATSCLVSDQTPGTVISTAKVIAINNLYNTQFFNGITDVPPFRVVEPVAITGGVSGPMKVGSTLTFNPVTVGTITTNELVWFRCDSPQAAIHAMPNCTRVPAATGLTYLLTAADLGKYPVPFLNAGNAWSADMYTPGNSMAVVAADAIAPVPPADPSGKPAVNEISNREIAVEGGTTIVLTGTNLGGVTSITIDGVEAKIVNKSDTSVTVMVPANPGKTGLVDLVVTGSAGTSTNAKALSYILKPVIALATKSTKLSGFTATRYSLSTSQKLAIKKLVVSATGYKKIACIGDVTGLKASATQRSLALKRAVASCAYAKSVNKSLTVKASSKQSRTTGSIQRLVYLSITP